MRVADDGLEQSGGGVSLAETAAIALKSLTANTLRTLLTALDVIIGVGAVVALMAIGEGSQQRSDQVTSFDSRMAGAV